SDIDQYTNAIEYTYNVAPQIYSSNTEKLRQVNPDKSFSALGLGSSTSSNSLMSMSMSTDTFYEMPSDPGLYQNQYDVKAGRWPESPTEVVLVLTGNGGMSDLMLYTLGLRDPAELDDMVKKFAAEEEIEAPADIEDPSYEDVLGVTFKLVNAADYYQRDDEFNVWKDKTDDTDYMRDLVENGEDVHVVGVVQPRDDATATMLSSGLNYPASLTSYVIDQAADSAIVKDQIAHLDTNVFTGKSFDDEEADENGFNMESLFTIDGDAIQAAFTIDQSKLSVDMSNALNLQGSLQNMPAAPEPNMDEIAGSLNIDLPVDQVSTLMSTLMEGYAGYLQQHLAENPPKIPELDANGKPTGNMVDNPNYTKPLSAQEWMNQPEIQAQIMAGVQGMIDQDALKAQLATALQGYVQITMTTYMGAMANELQSQVTTALQQSMNQMANNMASAMSIDPDKFKDAFQMNMSEEELGELMMSLMSTEEATYDNNLKKLGYADPAKPGGIDIYP
ncbi:MAG: ABC transporter ATP-binding protein, partial [Gordonibacter urolithinfaciens]